MQTWRTWIGLAALRAFEVLPSWMQNVPSSVIGSLIRHSGLVFVRNARRSIALCYPTMAPTAVEALRNEHCRSLGFGICETANPWRGIDPKNRQSAAIQGVEHLEAALARGHGAILIAARILGTVVPLNVLYRPTKNRLPAPGMHMPPC